jgi:hypothetical protein
MLKRAVRDRTKCLRIPAITQVFRILEKFSSERNPQAPALYKAIIFSLIESPNDLTIREVMYSNFMELFTSNSNIPCGLLLDPLFRQIQKLMNQVGVPFVWRTFDFTFYEAASRHPKLAVNQAYQLL